MKTCIFKNRTLLPIFPCTIDSHCPQERINRRYGIGFHQIFIISGGSGRIDVEGQSYSLSRGDMFFLKRDTPHSYYGDENFATTFLGFDGKLCESIFAFYEIGNAGVYKNKSYKAAENMISRFCANFENMQEDILSANTYSAVLTFFNSAMKTDCEPIERVKNYIEANFARPLTLKDVMKIYPYSKTRLCRDFADRYGTTIFRMINLVRLTHARAMLRRDPDIKVKKVAEDCGFSDVSYFCKMYKREYGVSPKNSV